jgi:aryl-alcohol dehydrogenase
VRPGDHGSGHIQTGAGAVINGLKVRRGASFVVFGAGAVGSSAVMAARVTGAAIIIAVDIVPSRLELAMELGATHVVNSHDSDPVAAIREISGGGVGSSLEASGHPEALRQAIDSRGYLGTCVVVGASPLAAEVSFDINAFMPGKTLLGILEGESVLDILMPPLIELNLQGRFPIRQSGESLQSRSNQPGRRRQVERRHDQAHHPLDLAEGGIPSRTQTN